MVECIAANVLQREKSSCKIPVLLLKNKYKINGKIDSEINYSHLTSLIWSSIRVNTQLYTKRTRQSVCSENPTSRV